jgi:hypothetical protein
MTLSITPTSPPLANNATDKTLAKVDCGKNAVYGVTFTYSGKPRFVRESRITKTEVTFTVEADSPNVTCTINKINNNNATVTASSLVPGTYKIAVKAGLAFTYTRLRTSRVIKYSKTVTATLDVWGNLQISSAEYLPVKCDRQKVTVTADATLTGGTLTLSATDKLKLYAAETGGTESNSLTLTLVNNSATCYVASGESPSNNASDQSLTASYSGDNVESATKDVTVYELKIEAPGKMVDIGTGNFIVPVMYNDDHDCGLAYTANWNCSVNCSAVSSSGTCTPDTHRELEPVWDYLYAGIYGEDDLVECKIEIKPIDMDGNVTVYPGSSNIRIWTQINKGEKSSIISARNNNHSYYVSQLPQIVYVEGINIGSDSLYVKYTPPSSKSIAQTKLLDIAVVSLVEKQNGTRKIINTNAIPIKFSVEGGNIFNGKCTWTVPNHNNTTSIGSNDNIDVTYGASGCNVTLPENAANRRFTTTVSVSIDGKLELSKTIRVAQATYQGTSVKTTEADRRLEVIGLATPPSGFANTELPDVVATVYSQKWFEKEYTGAWTKGTPPKSVTINDERLQYAPKKTNAYGLEVANRLTANNKRVYGIFVLPGAYNIFKKEDIISIAEHEIQHSRQDIEIASGTCNLRTIDNYHGGDYSKYITHVTQ